MLSSGMDLSLRTEPRAEEPELRPWQRMGRYVFQQCGRTPNFSPSRPAVDAAWCSMPTSARSGYAENR